MNKRQEDDSRLAYNKSIIRRREVKKYVYSENRTWKENWRNEKS